MNCLIRKNPACIRPRRSRSKKLLLLPVAAICLACSACEDSKPQPVSVSTEPVGDGLKVVGLGVVGAAVVSVLGRLMLK
mgnify:CR=1 FL=1